MSATHTSNDRGQQLAASSGLGESDPDETREGFARAPDPTIVRKSGTTIGRYTLLEPLGQGAMGMVFSAIDRELQRKVAIKLMLAPPTTSADLMHRERLLREAKAIAATSHPNVVDVFDVGVAGRDVYVVMELIEGTDLRRWIDRGKRPLESVLDVMRQAAAGLGAAHAAGIVHRDFKPANVMVAKDGRVRVLDFGLARSGPAEDGTAIDGVQSDVPEDATITRTGDHLGTPAYMSPEQHAGKRADAHSDQFAWAITLHEAVFGIRPFAGATGRAIARTVLAGERREVPRNRAPSWVMRLIDRCLAPRPEDRFASMADVVAFIDRRGDAPRRWTRVLAPAAVLVAAGVVMTVPDDPAPATACGPSTASVSIDAVQREQILLAFASAPRMRHGDGTDLVSRLEAYAAQIDDDHRAACEAHAAASLDDAALARRVACLDERRRHLETFASVVARGDAEALGHARDAALALPSVQSCVDDDGRMHPVPADPRLAAQVAEIRDTLGEAKVYRTLGLGDTALSLARTAEIRARAVAYPPLVAEAALAYGECASFEHEPELAERLLRDAAWLAEAEGHDYVLVEATTELAWLRAVDLRHYEEVDTLIATADAAARRYGDPGYHPILLNVRATVLEAEGRTADAIATMHEVVAALREGSPDDPSLASALHNLGNFQLSVGDSRAAAKSYAQGLELSLRLHGAEHPDVYWHRQAIADTKLVQGDYAAAVPEYEATLRYRERTYGADDPRLAATLNNLGHALIELDRDDEARIALERALRLKTADDASIASLANTEVMLGRAYDGLGRTDDALAMLGRAAVHRSDLGTGMIEVYDAIEAAAARMPADRPLSQQAREVVVAAARGAAANGDEPRAARLRATIR